MTLAQGEGGIDQPHVREALRKIAENAAAARIDFLSVKSQIVGVLEHPAKLRFGFLKRSAAKGKIFRCPEAADAESPLARTEVVAISVEQSWTGAEISLNPCVSAAHASRVSGLKLVF